MTTTREAFSELLSLTQSFIFNEYSSKDRLMTDPDTHLFYQQFHQRQTQTKKLQVPQVAPPPRQKIREHIPPPPKVAPLHPPKREEISVEKPLPQKDTLNVSKSSTGDSNTILELQPMPRAKEFDFSDVKKELTNLFPTFEINEQTPDDSEAKKINQQWKQVAVTPEVIILTFNESPEQVAFLQKVISAINENLAPAAMYSAFAIDKQKKWDSMFRMKGLRLVVTPDYGVYALPALKKYYRESVQQSQRYLGGIPVLLLTDIALYIKQPSLKPALWQALSAMLKK